jgi:hypothetical protein
VKPRIIFDLRDRPQVVTSEALVTVHTERQVGGKVEYGRAQYTALAARPATSEEVRAWREHA